MIYCPRCGTGNEDRDSKCSSCEFGLSQVKSLLNGDGGRLFLRIAITLVLFFSVPFVYFWLGRYWDLHRFEFITGFLFGSAPSWLALGRLGDFQSSDTGTLIVFPDTVKNPILKNM
ncbi:MAG: hypothetical protein IPL01_03890 [Acidobacteria bacterium]|nr:hypothetical protein [Acidobacteriota bacterium]